jgi:lipopolysaccharide transport system ATP-binding protein
MSEAIEVKGISKRYKLGHLSKSKYRTFRDDLVAFLKLPLRLITGPSHDTEEFWALKDVEFSVESGDVVGIIGRNGSGKSTLLKILSRITEPTSGEAILNGKVASLLEVGTGFHPELTGRENVYFNGSILGMSKAEIERKFDEIVSFAEVEKFLDTPVKFYSSGMYVRLAFAVAAHLDPDILIVDEVLAVGDAQFQKKCLGKMSASAEQGRTVLFVSHNMNAVQQLCNKCVYLKDGKVMAVGPTDQVINAYLQDTSSNDDSGKWTNPGDVTSAYFTPRSIRLVGANGKAVGSEPTRDKLFVEISGEIKKTHEDMNIGYALYSEDNETLYWSFSTDAEKNNWPVDKTGKFTMKSELPVELLNSASYRLELIAAIHMKEWLFQPNVTAPSINFTMKTPPLGGSDLFQAKRPSSLAPVLNWEVNFKK